MGQLFIFATIKRFGSLVNTLVTTTRKFFNILLSGGWAGMATRGGASGRHGRAGGRSRGATLPLPHAPRPSRACCAVLWNANPLLPQQWAAVALVFSGLLVSSWTKSRRGRHAADKSH